MNKNLSYQRRMRLQYASLMVPALVLFTVGLIVPIIMCFYFSLFSWDGFAAEKVFLGLGNYTQIIHDEYVMGTWKFTILFAVMNSIIADVGALLLAVLLHSAIRARTLHRTLVFIPCLFSSIVTGFVWKKIYSVVLPGIVESLGLKIYTQLFGSPNTVMAGLTIANCWQWIGLGMMIYLAALQSISPEYYEAPRVDGANAVQRFFHVTVPMLMPAIITCTVGLTTGALKTYDILVTATEGGPGRSSNTIVYYTFNAAFKLKQYGYGSAMSVSLIIMLLIVAVVQLKLFSKKEVQL